MKYQLIILLLLTDCSLTKAQKKPLDYAALENWPKIEGEQISNGGKYVLYFISSGKTGSELVIQSTENPWKQEIKGATDAAITEDSRRVVFKSAEDNLEVLELGTSSLKSLAKVSGFKVLPSGNGQKIVYQPKDQSMDLVLADLSTGHATRYPNIENYRFSNGGQILAMEKLSADSKSDTLLLLNLNEGTAHAIWRGPRAYSWTLDKSGSQIAFLTESGDDDQKISQVWYYKTGIDSAKLLMNNAKLGLGGMAISDNEPVFSGDGKNLFFYLHEVTKHLPTQKPDPNLIIWSYKDDLLAESPGTAKRVRNFAAVINLEHPPQVTKLETNEKDYSDFIHDYSDNKVLVSGEGKPTEWPGEEAFKNIYLVSTLDDSRKLLAKDVMWLNKGDYGFSPGGRYVTWFDKVKGQRFAYDVNTCMTKNITGKIPFPLNIDYSDGASYSSSLGMAGWLENDAALLVYDAYDIWQVDPLGIKPPINLTMGYGRKHQTVLRYLDFNNDQSRSLGVRDTLLLYAFDTDSKNSGFFKLALGRQDSPIKLIMRQLTFDINGAIRYAAAFEIEQSDLPLKAKGSETYLFRPSNAEEYPNLCITSDLIHFKALTNQEPQKNYNWYTNQLVKWKLPDGTANEGILFKPQDFDPKKKYPMMVFIYERFADALNVFLHPALSRADMNIPWYVSRGYMVFVPDIHYNIGYPGESACNSVVSGVSYLSSLPYLDSKHIGLQGHSWGGFETNYIVTHTHLFAAVSSGSGPTDLVSESGQVFISRSGGQQGMYAERQGRLGNSLWERPDLYVKNSSVFNADKVTTPLLIMHNPLDNSVYFPQGIELFTNLKFLGKKVWLIQYVNEGHAIEKEENQLDYTTKLDEFFDHYLKGTPAPEWMTGEAK